MLGFGMKCHVVCLNVCVCVCEFRIMMLNMPLMRLRRKTQ